MRLDFAELRGWGFVLEPMEDGHRDVLRDAMNRDQEGWGILPRNGFGSAFPGFWEVMTKSPNRMAYAVRESGGPLVGTSSFIDVDPINATLEIGATWYVPGLRGSGVNAATKLLMLFHAFAAAAERVQFKVDMRNARSLEAMVRIGAVCEGTIRRHLVTWTGHRRDSALFSILANEWPAVHARLLSRLRPAGGG